MDRFATAYPDLYQRDATGLHLRIVNGQIATASLATIGYASGALPDFRALRSLS